MVADIIAIAVVEFYEVVYDWHKHKDKEGEWFSVKRKRLCWVMLLPLKWKQTTDDPFVKNK